jgi:hypothetical protein
VAWALGVEAGGVGGVMAFAGAASAPKAALAACVGDALASVESAAAGVAVGSCAAEGSRTRTGADA